MDPSGRRGAVQHTGQQLIVFPNRLVNCWLEPLPVNLHEEVSQIRGSCLQSDSFLKYFFVTPKLTLYLCP